MKRMVGSNKTKRKIEREDPPDFPYGTWVKINGKWYWLNKCHSKCHRPVYHILPGEPNTEEDE